MKYIKYIIIGILFGIILIKSEVVSWFRIQEMFRFQSIHMFGIIGLAIITGMISLQIIKRYRIKTVKGESIELKPKKLHKGNLIGGIIFGLGWALTGACPGPLYALLGSGFLAMGVVLLSAVVGAWAYGMLRKNLPH